MSDRETTTTYLIGGPGNGEQVEATYPSVSFPDYSNGRLTLLNYHKRYFMWRANNGIERVTLYVLDGLSDFHAQLEATRILYSLYGFPARIREAQTETQQHNNWMKEGF